MKPQLRVGAAVVATTCVFFYLSCTFLFNPLTFANDEVAHLPWSWYRAPLEIEYGVLDTEGWRFVKVSDTREIRQVYQELRKASHSLPADPQSTEYGNLFWFGVRRVKDGAVLLDVRGQEGSSTLSTRGVTVALTPKLENLLQDRLSLARRANGK